MAEIRPGDGRPVIDYMARDADSLLRAMRELVPEKLPSWRDVRGEADFGNVLLELFAHLGDILSYYTDRVANESFLGTARSRRSVIEHLRLIGYQLGTAAPASALLTVSVDAAVADPVTVRRGDAFATRSRKDAPSVRFEYTGGTPLVIDFGAITPVDGVRTFGDPANRVGIPVEEGRLFADEVLGRSDGSADQRFAIPHPQVVYRPPGSQRQAGTDVVITTVPDGGSPATWKQRDTLAFSGAGDHHFVLEVDENERATVVFGDGTFGAVAPRQATVRATYRTGGGQAGNVAPGEIQTVVNAPAIALLGATVTNPLAATGGDDRESIEHAVRHAPAVSRSQGRAVTAQDYESLALSLPGVGKVLARRGAWNQVTLVVAPSGGGHVSDVLELKLKAFLEDKRMLSQTVEVQEARYVEILVTARVGVESYYVPEDVFAAVRRSAGALLAFDAVEFGQPVFLSSFYKAATEVPGVRSVAITEFRRGDSTGSPLEPFGRIVLVPEELPTAPDSAAYAGGIQLLADPGGA
jgi:hypothetical protein